MRRAAANGVEAAQTRPWPGGRWSPSPESRFVTAPTTLRSLRSTPDGRKLASGTAASGQCRFITDSPVTRDTVAELAACGRARWKIENETFNVLKTKGYNLGHNFGHGQRNLSAVLATLNLLAFACHTVCELAETTWEQAVQRIGARRRFFEHLRTLTVYLVFPTWDDLLATIVGAAAPQRPP